MYCSNIGNNWLISLLSNIHIFPKMCPKIHFIPEYEIMLKQARVLLAGNVGLALELFQGIRGKALTSYPREGGPKNLQNCIYNL